MKLITLSSIISVIAVFIFVSWLRQEEHSSIHRRTMLPGQLSMAHSSLESQCSQCHTPLQGITAVKCIQCHASNSQLLSRQPTAFHASIQTCTGCHIEHQGRTTRPTLMDHQVLVKEARSKLSHDQTVGISEWLRKLGKTKSNAVEQLACVSCHSNEDKHRGLFGKDCVSCHSFSKWAIDSFRHPSPKSRDCAQCHQAPPSHYMMHFEMVSKKVAEIEHADVRQCYLCHQTTSWNDIKGVGWYKHH